jgi:hypothetical protein
VFKVQHQNEIKYVFRLTQLYFILSFLLLTASFGLNRPSLGHYLQKLKNAGACSITHQFHGIPFTFITVLYN